jgi:hypothetical protein
MEIFESLGYIAEGPLILDSQLGVKIQFVLNIESGVDRIELVEDLPDGRVQPISKILNQRAGSYHLAYMVDSILEFSKSSNMRRMTECQPAQAFNEKHVCFFMSRDGAIVELISNSLACECLNAN